MSPRPLSLALVSLGLLLGCAHVPSAKEQASAVNHYDLGVVSQQNGDIRTAYAEYETAVKLDPTFAEAWLAKAQLLHLSFGKPEEAIADYRKALEIRPTYSEAKNNLGTVYLSTGQYDEAVKLFEEVLNDMRYPTPYIAQANLGWAQFKQGKLEQAVENTKASVTTNPKFCLGYKNLGAIYESQGKVEAACEQFGHFRESCPDNADAYFREGVCLTKLGKVEPAKEAFATCQAKAKPDEPLQKDCKQYGEQLR